jgi:bisphosphoglycerate-independent phosphoglycerate mutase (AlkP superfamily)
VDYRRVSCLPKKNRLASIVRIIPKLLDLDGKCLITADHGNCKQTRNPGGSPNTHRSSG